MPKPCAANDIETDNFKNAPNISLCADKYAFNINAKGLVDKEDSKKVYLDNLTTKKPSLRAAQESIKSFLAVLKNSKYKNFRTVSGKLKKGLAIDLSSGLIENAGISLDRLFGYPIIKGSAVKGAAAHAARDDENIELKQIVFGDEKKHKGAVVFFAAKMWRGCVKKELIAPQRNGKSNIICFPCVEKGSIFVFIIAADEVLLKKTGCKHSAGEILDFAEHALAMAFETGLGAKTSSSFGWFEKYKDLDENLQKEIKARPDAENDATLSTLEKYRKKLESCDPTKEDLTNEAKILKEKDETLQREFINFMKNNHKNKLKTWKKYGKDAYKIIEEVAKSLNIEL
ncbi:MAG: hypothetical protein J6P03_06390 [Opitutales bacterium]|nr:hypothetical protein [Opitutales bacterium]